MTPGLGMSIDQLIHGINTKRARADATLKPVRLSTRPSNSAPGKTTLEVWAGDDLMAKSISGGAINWYLKGMYSGFTNSGVKVVNFNAADLDKFSRSIDWE